VSEATKSIENTQSARNLAAVVPVIAPPGNEDYYHPVGITLTAGPGDVVFYTVDGSLPNRTSAFVQSGQYVVVNTNSTLQAMAAPSATVPGGESAVATETYTVHMQVNIKYTVQFSISHCMLCCRLQLPSEDYSISPTQLGCTCVAATVVIVLRVGQVWQGSVCAVLHRAGALWQSC
jgi:Chitobiase/beta-hexosaminidase C-terminal domain